MTTDKPEPPAEVWLCEGDTPSGWTAHTAEPVESHRYVLAPEGSLVLDPDMARVFTDRLHAPQSPDRIIEVTLDFRGGAS